MSMRILIATPLYPPDIGGPATYAKILHDELPQHGIQVEIIPYGRVRHLPKLLSYPLYTCKVFWGARNADSILALDPVHTGLCGWLAGVLWRKKFAVRIAGDYAWEQGQQRFGVKENLDGFVKQPSAKFPLPVKILRFVQTFVARRAAKIIVPSKYLKQIIETWGISPEKIIVIYNAFDGTDDAPDREASRKELGLSGTVLLSAGRLVPWKGFKMLVHVMDEMSGKFPDAKLYIAGSGPMQISLEEQISALGLKDRVIMLGNVPHGKLMKYISAADCFALNTGYEGLSHQLLEVLAVGTPIVTTNVGGNPELIEDGKTGMLVPHGDIIALHDAVVKMLTSPEEAKKMTEAGKQFVTQFTASRMVEETKRLLEEVAK